GIARRTKWYGRGAISPDSHPASTAPPGPRGSGARRGARSRRGRRDRRSPDSGRGSLNRRKVTGWGWRGRQQTLVSSLVSPVAEENVRSANWFLTGGPS